MKILNKLFKSFVDFLQKKIFFIAFLNFFTVLSFKLFTYITLQSLIIIFTSTVFFHFLLLKYSKIHENKFYFEVLILDLLFFLNFLLLNVETDLLIILFLLINNCLFIIIDFFWTHKDRI